MSLRAIPLVRVIVSSPKMIPMTYQKLHCTGEAYRLILREILRDRHTDSGTHFLGRCSIYVRRKNSADRITTYTANNTE